MLQIARTTKIIRKNTRNFFFTPIRYTMKITQLKKLDKHKQMRRDIVRKNIGTVSSDEEVTPPLSPLRK